MAFWDSAWDAISKVGSWMENNKNATNMIGNTIMGVGGYFAQKEAGEDLIRQQRELLNMQDRLKSQYSAVPDSDWSYKSLTVDESPGLANGGILTEMKKNADRKHKGV